MDIKAEKSQIIEQINHITDINLLKAIKNLLAFASAKEKVFDFVVSEEQKVSVRNRVKEYENNPEDILSWNDVEAKLKKQ